MCINWNAALKEAKRQNEIAKDGVMKWQDCTYIFTFNRYEGIYVVTKQDDTELEFPLNLRLNVRKIAQAKRDLIFHLTN
jgi:hypothetical protein